MILPTVSLRPNVDAGEAMRLLKERADNIVSEAQPAGVTHIVDRRSAYVNATTTTEKRLRTIFSMHDAAALFDGPRHRDICSMTAGEQLGPMISAEVDDISHRLNTLSMEHDNALKIWEDRNAAVVVLDSTVYMEHPNKFEDVDFHEMLNRSGPVRILVPMVVIDELDRLKTSGDPKKRWRPAHALAVIDDRIDNPPWLGLLHDAVHESAHIRGPVVVEIVFDFPSHIRLPLPDDEIVDRAVACQPYAGPVTLVTYDTGQAQRARMARLNVLKLRNDRLAPPPDAA
jgi:rRNA-processing protein FCF1